MQVRDARAEAEAEADVGGAEGLKSECSRHDAGVRKQSWALDAITALSGVVVVRMRSEDVPG